MTEAAAAAVLVSQATSFLATAFAELASSGPTGDEPALQLLILPQRKPLPSYSKEATFLAPSHCRLCFHPFPNRPARSEHIATAADGSEGETTGSGAAGAADEQEVLAHLKTHGLLSMEDRHDDDED